MSTAGRGPKRRQQRIRTVDGSLSHRELRRARILAAMTNVLAQEGLQGASVTRVLRAAGVDRTTFYELFADRDDCLLAAVSGAIKRTRAEVHRAVREDRDRPAQIRAGLTALLSHFEAEPNTARLCLTYSRHTDARMRRTRARALADLATAIEGIEPEGRPSSGPISAEAIVHGALGVIESHLNATPDPRLIELAGPLMSFIVLPYRGSAAARKELKLAEDKRKKAPTSARRNGDVASVRITYRTMRVLAAIAEQPGLSNAEVAQRAEIKDPGQISKLLKRLEGLGLVSNKGNGHAVSEPNAWALTAKGRRTERAILDHHTGRG